MCVCVCVCVCVWCVCVCVCVCVAVVVVVILVVLIDPNNLHEVPVSLLLYMVFGGWLDWLGVCVM